MPRMTGGCRVDGQTKFIPRNVFAKFRTIFAKKHELLTLHIFDMSVLFSACSMLIILYIRVYVNICVQVFLSGNNFSGPFNCHKGTMWDVICPHTSSWGGGGRPAIVLYP